jgi:hypothetical protein
MLFVNKRLMAYLSGYQLLSPHLLNAHTVGAAPIKTLNVGVKGATSNSRT